MRILKIAWVGTRTDEAPAMVDFLERILGLTLSHTSDEMWVYSLPDRSKVEVFGPGYPENQHFTTGPVVEFFVDDVDAATEELRRAGVPIISGPVHFEKDDVAWVHFRAPDGNVYGLTQGRDVQPL